jgi:cysteine-rich repeat protein
MSGGWQRSFSLPAAADVSLVFRYLLEQSPTYESDEISQLLVSIDGGLVGTMGNDYVVQLTGDGQGGVGQPRSTGWQTQSLDLGSLGAGAHSLVIGGYNSKKTLSDEVTGLWIDDVGVHTVVAPLCGDGVVSPGEECDDGATQNGDCCNSTCGFEVSGSGCDDADACSELDACDGAGLCAGSPLACDDGDLCTVGSCNSLSGCSFEPIPGCGGPQALPASGPLGRMLIGLLLVLASAAALRPRSRHR